MCEPKVTIDIIGKRFLRFIIVSDRGFWTGVTWSPKLKHAVLYYDIRVARQDRYLIIKGMKRKP